MHPSRNGFDEIEPKDGRASCSGAAGGKRPHLAEAYKTAFFVDRLEST